MLYMNFIYPKPSRNSNLKQNSTKIIINISKTIVIYFAPFLPVILIPCTYILINLSRKVFLTIMYSNGFNAFHSAGKKGIQRTTSN